MAVIVSANQLFQQINCLILSYRVRFRLYVPAAFAAGTFPATGTGHTVLQRHAGQQGMVRAGPDAFTAADTARIIRVPDRINAQLAGFPARSAVHTAFSDHPVAVQGYRIHEPIHRAKRAYEAAEGPVIRH